MNILSPSAVDLLAEMDKRGIEWKAHGDTIRFHPRHAMTFELLERLRAKKAELLARTVIEQARNVGDGDLATALEEAWGERIAICIEDGKVSQESAEAIALQQLRKMSARIILDKMTSIA